MADPNIPEVDAAATEALVVAGALLLDVREADEWAAGHAPAAVHLPMGRIPESTGELPTDRRIACICRSGARSGRVTEYLRGFGFDIVNVAGGMQGWAASGRPVVTDAGDPGSGI
jgi:rhodanese-related sulfurtransferase